jgi:hypothetical protein
MCHLNAERISSFLWEIEPVEILIVDLQEERDHLMFKRLQKTWRKVSFPLRVFPWK